MLCQTFPPPVSIITTLIYRLQPSPFCARCFPGSLKVTCSAFLVAHGYVCASHEVLIYCISCLGSMSLTQQWLTYLVNAHSPALTKWVLNKCTNEWGIDGWCCLFLFVWLFCFVWTNIIYFSPSLKIIMTLGSQVFKMLSKLLWRVPHPLSSAIGMKSFQIVTFWRTVNSKSE